MTPKQTQRLVVWKPGKFGLIRIYCKQETPMNLEIFTPFWKCTLGECDKLILFFWLEDEHLKEESTTDECDIFIT